MTVLLGAGRTALGTAFLAFPVASVRLLGVDTASANRVVWLARMAAVRDAALGLGVLGAATARRGRVPALVASGLVDATDAAVIVAAAREHRVDRARGYLIAAGAAAGAVAGFATAADLLRRRG
jgi:peptide-methionine (R)-S-oxide reductase